MRKSRGADVTTTFLGSIISFHAETARGEWWMRKYVGDGATIAEHRCGIDIIRGMVAAGLRVQDTASKRFACA